MQMISDYQYLLYRMLILCFSIPGHQNSRVDWTVPVYSVRSPPDELAKCFRVAIPAKQLETYCTSRQHPHGETYKFVMNLKYEIFM